jgi:hypothetical protein
LVATHHNHVVRYLGNALVTSSFEIIAENDIAFKLKAIFPTRYFPLKIILDPKKGINKKRSDAPSTLILSSPPN